ncbi:MAG: phospho-N-acetylmuramoyl-pentapeptide-transferase [Parcubacteria group bacterium]
METTINFQIIRILFMTFLAFVIAIALTPALAHFLYKFRLSKEIRNEGVTPIFSRLHAPKAGTPTMGGILVWVSVLILILLSAVLPKIFPSSEFFSRIDFLSRAETLLPLGALIASAMVGFVDDIFNTRKIGASGGGLRIRHKILLYFLIALFGAYWFYAKLDWTTIHVPFAGNFDIGIWYIPIFVFIIVSTAFSVNETDGLDGLAGGTLLAAFGAYGAIAFAQQHYDLALFCAVIIGALLAFLWFNINPARFFMGDTGSMSLGVTLGIIAMLTNSALFLPIIGLVFIIEALSVIVQVISRKFFHRKVFLSAPIHHHLEARGWPEPKIVMRFWIVSAVTAVLGLVLAIMDFQ